MHEYRLEQHRIRRGFDRAATGYEDTALLAREVRVRLLERLDYLAIQPQIIVDMGAATGAAARQLAAHYPRARVISLDLSQRMLRLMPAGQAQVHAICADACHTPLPDHSVDLIFSNLMLPWCDDLDAVLAEFRRLITPRGGLTFSSFGPDTLYELRRAWRAADAHEHVHAFIDMHDIGDALVRAGFVEPVMDVERFTLTYQRVSDLQLDLRRMGSLNALPGRHRGLIGRPAAQRLAAGYEVFRERAHLPATFEVIYGQAWGPLPSAGVALTDGLARIPVDRIGRR